MARVAHILELIVAGKRPSERRLAAWRRSASAKATNAISSSLSSKTHHGGVKKFRNSRIFKHLVDCFRGGLLKLGILLWDRRTILTLLSDAQICRLARRAAIRL